MARSKSSKTVILDSLSDRIDKSTSVVFASLKGLKVKETEELRRAARAENNECLMAKKTLFARAFKDRGFDAVDFKALEGEVVATFAYADEVSPARILAKFSKDHEHLKVLGGLLLRAPAGSQYLDAASLGRLAKLPTREQLLGSVVGSIASPLRGLVGVLNGNLTGFVRVLNGIAQSKS